MTKIYKVTVTNGVYAHEEGVGYSFEPWGHDTDRLNGYSEPVEVALPPGYALAEDMAGTLRMYPGGFSADEALALGVLHTIQLEREQR